MDVVVQVGGWEHECCGEAIERNQLIDLSCVRRTAKDGQSRLVWASHDTPGEEQIQGWVTELHVMLDGGAAQPILRVPSGQALCGFDDEDDGHLEGPWTGEVITSRTGQFLVTVRMGR